MIGFLCFLAGPPGWIAYALMRSRERRREQACPALPEPPYRERPGNGGLIVVLVLGLITAMVIGANLPDGVGEPRYVDGIPVPTARPNP